VPSSGMSYLAVRYRNTDCSSKWLTVTFDNIAISGNTVGINELSANDKINIYPNPATGKVIIDSKLNINSIELYNVLGEKIYSDAQFKLQTSNEIDLSGFHQGAYFIKMFDGTNTYTKKILVQ
jgi:hypothetical protein